MLNQIIAKVSLKSVRPNNIISLSKNRLNMSAQSVRSTAASGSQVYESERAVFEYLLFHFGEEADLLPFGVGPKEALSFVERCADICAIALAPADGSKSRVLDVGCAVGGSSFSLARHFEEVVGIDYSHHFIDAANKLKSDGVMDYEILKQGKIFESRKAVVPSMIDKSRVSFMQGDACDLDISIGQFDVILASNLLCRLPQPKKFLLDSVTLLKPGGSLVLVSPYSWLEEYTSEEHWIGGRSGSDDCRTAFMKIMQEELPYMNLTYSENIPFILREHERKYQFGVSDCTVWKKDA